MNWITIRYLLSCSFLDREEEHSKNRLAAARCSIAKIDNSTAVPEKLRYYFSGFSKVYKMNSQISLLCKIQSSVDQKVFEIQCLFQTHYE